MQHMSTTDDPDILPGHSPPMIPSPLSPNTSSSESAVGSVRSFAWGKRPDFVNETVGLVPLPPSARAPLVGFVPDGARSHRCVYGPVFPEQAYVVVNDAKVLERTGKTLVFAPDGSVAFNISYRGPATTPYDAFSINEGCTDRELLRVGKPSSDNRILKLPSRVEIANVDLYMSPTPLRPLYRLSPASSTTTQANNASSPRASSRGTTELMSRVDGPRLVVEGKFGADTVEVRLAGVTVPVGYAGGGLLGTFLPEKNRYGVEIRNCTKEEGLLIMAAMHAVFLRQQKDTMPERGVPDDSAGDGGRRRISETLTRSLRQSLLSTRRSTIFRRRMGGPR